jgi:hypothetical protein
MSTRITIQVDEIPTVEQDTHWIEVGGWTFSLDQPVTAEDVAAFAVAKAWFEKHPELVVDCDDEY